jgi:hypothetical protein
MIDAELQLETLPGLRQGRRHESSIVQQHINAWLAL